MPRSGTPLVSKKLRTTVLASQQRQRTAAHQPSVMQNSKALPMPTQFNNAKDIQHLEVEAIEEEGRDCLAFLTTCGATLRANPPEALGIMVTPYHLLLGNAPTSALLSIPWEYPLLNRNPPCRLLLPLPQQ